MADSWAHEFCLGCDKQTDGTAYCSESCRLADFEKTSMPGSVASSPGFNSPSYPWLSQHAQPQTGFFFSNPQPFGTSSPTHLASSGRSTYRTLQPSSSNSSLCSMSTVSSNTEATQLSEKTRQELQSYAASFDNARLARRRSY
ncbi:hypothetical protein F5X68DRAFT_35423 [Plectosphaerella plurivora]|uniref:Uncharacterized protein n=1 Tax=Plectosphaerella plurivora TaxID=936078 RepID=A0A9P8V6C7_9PEZI|nr:hypothetical protein F5X68DRAFT_35423 [Plectosphaerella plurivora]